MSRVIAVVICQMNMHQFSCSLFQRTPDICFLDVHMIGIEVKTDRRMPQLLQIVKSILCTVQRICFISIDHLQSQPNLFLHGIIRTFNQMLRESFPVLLLTVRFRQFASEESDYHHDILKMRRKVDKLFQLLNRLDSACFVIRSKAESILLSEKSGAERRQSKPITIKECFHLVCIVAAGILRVDLHPLETILRDLFEARRHLSPIDHRGTFRQFVVRVRSR